MKPTDQIISSTCRKKLETQGYLNFSDKDLLTHHFGIRLAYWACITLASLALIHGGPWFVLAVALLAFFATFPPYHPVDYLYNYGLRYVLKKPKLPPRTNQSRFACGMATVWLAVTAYLLANNQALAGRILGFALVSVGLLVSTTDICIPSMIYNYLFARRKTKTT